jgi:hypothetical protein
MGQVQVRFSDVRHRKAVAQAVGRARPTALVRPQVGRDQQLAEGDGEIKGFAARAGEEQVVGTGGAGDSAQFPDLGHGFRLADDIPLHPLVPAGGAQHDLAVAALKLAHVLPTQQLDVGGPENMNIV